MNDARGMMCCCTQDIHKVGHCVAAVHTFVRGCAALGHSPQAVSSAGEASAQQRWERVRPVICLRAVSITTARIALLQNFVRRILQQLAIRTSQLPLACLPSRG